MKKITRQNAESYWWYRMIKIFYILAVILFAIIAFYLIKNGEYGHIPKTDFYASSYGFECTKGSTYVGGNIPSSLINFDISKGKNQIYSLKLSGYEALAYKNLMGPDVVLKKICLNGKSVNFDENDSDFLAFKAQPIPSDSQSAYRFIMREEIKDKTWSKVFWQWLVILFWIWVILKLVPKIFNYIVFGKEYNNSDLE